MQSLELLDSKPDSKSNKNRGLRYVVFVIVLLCIAAAVVTILHVTLVGSSTSSSADETTLGQEQLVQILNAAWVRVLSDGTYRSIIGNECVTDVITNFAGCLPTPENAPFPDNGDLVGNARNIIQRTRTLRFGCVPESPVSLAGIETSELSGVVRLFCVSE